MHKFLCKLGIHFWSRKYDKNKTEQLCRTTYCKVCGKVKESNTLDSIIDDCLEE